jgi:hypothetical protein
MLCISSYHISHVNLYLNASEKDEDEKLSLALIVSLFIWFSGDEVLAINGESADGLTHLEAVTLFKKVKKGPVVLTVNRRAKKLKDRTLKSQSCDNLIDA